MQLATEAVGIPYDWEAIISFALSTIGLPFVSDEWPAEGVPSHLVCSSSADLFYESVGLPNPGGYTKTRGTDPQDWADFVVSKGWERA